MKPASVLRVIFSFLGLCICSTLSARFSETDASEVDREENQGTETYNDQYSYRPPRAWGRYFREANIAYHVNAGSYTARRFMFHEEIKIGTDENQKMHLRFLQHRREDMVESMRENELRLSFNQWDPFRIGILADGGTFKEYGDLGFALAFRPAKNTLFELQYWAVDVFYNTKKEFTNDRYRTKPYSIVGLAHADFARVWRVEGSISIDSPFFWERYSQSYEYEYQRSKQELKLGFGEQQPLGVELSYARDAKSEEKTYRIPAGNYGKSLQRTQSLVELSTHFALGAVWEMNLGLNRLQRDAHYGFWQDATVTDDLLLEQSSENVVRNESGYFLTLAETAENTRRLQVGLFANNMLIEKPSSQISATELKLQTAWEFFVQDQAGVFLNITWDLDELGKNFPYNKKPFKPWGGGNIQFRADF